MTMLEISLFTDPGCPWAFSAEPFRRRIEWLYGDHAAWELVMVGLAEDPAEFEAKGLTTAMMAAGSKQIAAAHGMPIDTNERERLSATLPACRAVVAARLNSPGHQQTLLRAIQARGFAGELIDEPATIAAAAADAEIDAHDLEQWSAQAKHSWHWPPTCSAHGNHFQPRWFSTSASPTGRVAVATPARLTKSALTVASRSRSPVFSRGPFTT